MHDPGRPRPRSRLAIPALLLALAFVGAIEATSLGRGAPVLTPPAFLLSIAIGLSTVTLLADRQDGFAAPSGLGTALYGLEPTVGRVATAFVVLFGLPIVALQSYVVVEATAGAAPPSACVLRPLPSVAWSHAGPRLLAGWTALGVGFVAIAALS